LHDRGNLDLVSFDTLDNAVVLEQQFSQVAPVLLGRDSARFREQGQHFRRCEDALGKQLGVVLRIPADVLAYLSQAGQRGRGPD
jgi:hypothetical protein